MATGKVNKDSGHHTTPPHPESGKGLALHAIIHPSCFAYTLVDLGEEAVIAFSSSETDSSAQAIEEASLREWLAEHRENLCLDVDIARICIATPAFHLLNDPALATAAQFSKLHPMGAGTRELLTDTLAPGLIVHYGIEKWLFDLLAGQFNSDSLCFGERGLLLHLFEGAGLQDGVYCQLAGGEATIGVRTGNRMVFFNKFGVANSEDLLYYVLLAFQSHQMDPANESLYLAGDLEEGHTAYELLYEYVRHIDFMVPDRLPATAFGGPDTASRHFNLLSIR